MDHPTNIETILDVQMPDPAENKIDRREETFLTRITIGDNVTNRDLKHIRL